MKGLEGSSPLVAYRSDSERLMAGGLLKVHPDATRFSGLSRTTLYGLMDSGKLAFVKIGKCRRIPKSALERLLAEHLVQRSNGLGTQPSKC